MNLRIRAEEAGDIDTIATITRDAYVDNPHSRHSEHLIVDGLRSGRALALSLVAELDGVVVGHVAFSRVDISDGSTGWYCLGPLAVTASARGAGVGGRLVREGLARLRESLWS